MQNTEAEILASTYHDRMTVTRSQSMKNSKTHEMERQEAVIYKNVPCALSQKGSNPPEKDSANHRRTANDSYVIFSLPILSCQAGDAVEVVTQTGQVYRGRTGRSMQYSSHAETPLKVEVLV